MNNCINPAVESYSRKLQKRANKYPYNQFISAEPHVKERQINRRVSEYSKRATYNKSSVLMLNLQALVNKWKGKLARMLIK